MTALNESTIEHHAFGPDGNQKEREDYETGL